MFDRLKGYKDKSIKRLIINGHGIAAGCGVKGVVDVDSLTDEEIAILKAKLAPGARLEIWSCSTAETRDKRIKLQRFANRLGVTIVATTGAAYTPIGGATNEKWIPGSTDGTWLEFVPGEPIPENPPATLDPGQPKKP
jgi:hypothetical protein